jgi:hypothetical protein
LETLIEEEELRKYPIVSVIDERSGCAIVIGHKEVKIRLAGQMSIFNAEAQAIIEAIKITRKWGVDKRIIMTDSLSNIVAQEETFTRGNSKKNGTKRPNGRIGFESKADVGVCACEHQGKWNSGQSSKTLGLIFDEKLNL